MQQDTVLPCPAILLAEARVGVLSCPSDVASANLTAMKRPAVFFDRDNTLIANDGYLGDASQVKLIASGEVKIPLAIAATKSSFGKCERCWNYRDAVGKDRNHPTLCDRCVEAVQ